MSIIWCGGEDVDFLTLQDIVYSYTTAYRRANYSRVAMEVAATWGSYLLSPYITPVSSVWMHCFLRVGSWGASTSYITMSMRKFASNTHIGIGPVDNGDLSIIKYDGVYTTLASAVSPGMGDGTLHLIDVQIINYGPSGTVKVWNNGTLCMSYTGAIAGNGETTLDQFYIYGSDYASHPWGHYSEMIVADEDTRAMSLKTLVPEAAGDANEWTGAYTDVDEVETDDADYIYTFDGSKSLQLNLTGSPVGIHKIKAVKVIGRIVASNPRLDVKLGVKTNSVVHLGNQRGLSPSFQPYNEMFQSNPETASDWTESDIDSLQIAFQTVSTTTSTTTTT